jgi:hypothetical protein
MERMPRGKPRESINTSCYINLYNREMVAMPEKEVLHYPRLDTVLMVEEFIQKRSGEFKKRSLREHLPKQVMYQTFCVIFDYLLESGKIAVDQEGKVGWIWNPALVRKYTSRRYRHLVVR